MVKKSKLLLSILAIWFIQVTSSAQPFGNEWIDFNQTYYRIRLANDGIYRINQSDLLNSGIPANSIDPRRMQLFYRGVEQAIVIEGQEDGSFDTNDFIEFYGKRNDGNNESELYIDPSAQPHTLHSLFSDSSAYFFTWKLSPQNGKRATTFFENNVTSIPEEDYHNEENLLLNTTNYSPGTTYSGGNVLLSQFDFGEGWTGSDISAGSSQDFTLSNIGKTFQTGPRPSLSILLVGRNNLEQDANIEVGSTTTNLRLLGTAQFSAHNNYLFESEIDWSDISVSGDLVVRVSMGGTSSDPDRAAVSYVRLEFPQEYDMSVQNSKRFNLIANPTGKSYLEITNSPGNIRLYDITDSNNIVRIGVNQTAAQFDAIIPLTVSPRSLYAFNSPLSSFSIGDVSFSEIEPTDFNYITISHPSLMASTSDGSPDPVNSHKLYRESPEGGSFKVLVANIINLYDQFNYGEYSPLAIRRFINFMINNGSIEYLYIIGEALDIPNNPDRQTALALEASGLSHLVPTMGFPGSDIALLAGLGGTDVFEPIPVGRITANSPDQVQAYLDKLIEYEQGPFNDLWRKRLVHLSGGTTPLELVSFKSNVDGFKSIAENDFLGGQVSTVSKQSSSPIELFNVSEAINEGVGLITFFGHSGPNGSDIDIGRVSDPSFGYDNKGLYNSIIVNGCNAGDIFGSFFSLGEDWILTPNKGSVTYMAHSDNGLSTQLRRYTDLFYRIGYGDSTFISQPVGVIKKETGKRFVDQFSNGPVQKAQVQQFILQGDPAIKLFGTNQSDYAITENDISISTFDAGTVTALTDSFAINVIIKNYGRTTKEPFEIKINRFLTDGAIQSFGPEMIDPVNFQDTVSITIQSIVGQNGFGNNRFEVILDEPNAIEEINELNNTASIDFFISSGTTVNLFPRNFGVESNSVVRFISQSSDLLSEKRGFIFELDTTKAFNSPLLTSKSNDFKVLAEWLIALPYAPIDTVVYYWRTKFTEIKAGEEDVFAESSFSYIPESLDGWAQSTFDQFDLLVSNGLVKDEISNQWQFVETQLSALIKTHGTAHFTDGPVIYDSLSVFLDNQELLRTNSPSFICRSNSINAIAFDKASLFPYLVFGVNNSGRDPQKCGSPFIINNLLDSEIISPNLLLNSYIDNVNEGDLILLFSIGELQYESWPAEVTNQLNGIGVTMPFLNGLTTGQPVIILGKKGSASGSAIELTRSLEESLSFNDVLKGKFTTGSLTTARIGPSSEWKNFFGQASFSEQPPSDNFTYDIIGVDLNGGEIVLFNDLANDNQDISSINPETYPFLKLKFNTDNPTQLKSSQLRKWQVTFDGVPEGILLSTDESVARNNTITRSEGESLETNFYFKNISNIDFSDSIPVNLSTFNMERRESFPQSLILPPVISGDSANFTYDFNTFGKAGLNDLNVFVNPNGPQEASINNNIIDINDFLQVNSDEINPILDVTFDGVYILDGDIVSPSPAVLIKLKDENLYLFKQDTSGVEISLKKPCQSGCEFERVNFSNPDISITQANESTDFQIEYNPKGLQDGIYTLQVQGSDFSGNISGIEPYQINFMVINESTITHFYPYPNPFSTSTRFVFTLTGSEIPDQIKIQIMTVSGKIVRAITQDELGPIHIGHNLTDFAWDGRDEYGDQLANGVYLYRVILRNNGQRIDKMNTSADKAFKNGFGKLYLLR